MMNTSLLDSFSNEFEKVLKPYRKSHNFMNFLDMRIDWMKYSMKRHQ